MRKRARREEPLSRDEAVESARRTLLATSLPRLLMFGIVGLTGVAGFLVSFGLMRAGVTEMWLRYPIAVLAAYAAFLAMLRLWLWAHGAGGPDLDVDPGFSGDVPSGSGGGQTFEFGGGGDFGGGGASDSFGVAPAPVPSPSSGIDIEAPGCLSDLDDGVAIVVVVVAAAGALLAAFYVVYIAPVLLAEILVDAVLVATLYRKVRREEHRYWLWTAVRKTWVPVLLIALMLGGAGYAMQLAEPDARSIGEFWRALAGES